VEAVASASVATSSYVRSPVARLSLGAGNLKGRITGRGLLTPRGRCVWGRLLSLGWLVTLQFPRGSGVGCRAWAHILRPERWWPILAQVEARGNSGGGPQQFWRANRLSEV